MAYYNLTMLKKNLELIPGDNSLDDKLTAYGIEADAYIDALLGNTTPLSTVPQIVTQAASNYAAGRYLWRVKADMNGKDLIAEAEKQIKLYKASLGRVTVYG